MLYRYVCACAHVCSVCVCCKFSGCEYAYGGGGGVLIEEEGKTGVDMVLCERLV